jgi:hypothetical protein
VISLDGFASINTPIFDGLASYGRTLMKDSDDAKLDDPMIVAWKKRLVKELSTIYHVSSPKLGIYAKRCT